MQLNPLFAMTGTRQVRSVSTDWALPALVLLAMIATRIVMPENVDVTGLMTWTERTLDGARPYVDFVEINPPGSFLIYMPAVWIGRVLGISPIAALDALIFGLIGASLWLCSRLGLPEDLPSDRMPMLAAAGLLVLGVLPARTFGEREHIGLIAMLPLLVAAATMSRGRLPPLNLRLAAGLGSGLAMVAKPHLGLSLGAAFLFVTVMRRDARQFVEPLWYAAGGVVLAYLAFCRLAYPEFFDVAVPLVVDVYLPIRQTFAVMMSRPAAFILLTLAVLAWMLAPRPFRAPLPRLLWIAAAVAYLAFLLQGKGWPYQAYPAIACAALAFAIATREPAVVQRSRASVGIFLAALASIVAVAFSWNMHERDLDMPALVQMITDEAPRPTMLAITPDVAVGHPLVRKVNGTWVQSVGSLWGVAGALRQINDPSVLPVRKARMQAHLQYQIDLLVRDLKTKPDIILFDVDEKAPGTDDWLHWARQQPKIARLLNDYRRIGQSGEILVMARNKAKQQLN